MPELRERIRSHYDTSTQPITVDEIISRGGEARSEEEPGESRWRSGRVLVAAAVVAVLAVTAVVVYRVFDSTTEDPTEVEVIDEPEVDEASPDESDSPPEVVYVEAEGQRVGVPESWSDPYFEVMAWRDGFLAIVPVQPEFPFPELTDEQSALFSEELRDLFADDPPETVDEAAQRAADADLYGEMAEVVEANPELYELLVGNRAEGWVEAWTSVDGMEWELVGNFDPPVDGSLTVTTTDSERLVVATDSNVSVTTDLLEWETLSLSEFTPAVPSDAVTTVAQTLEFSAGPDRWALAVSYVAVLDPTVVDITALIPDADLGSEDGHVKWEATPEGVTWRTGEGDFDDGSVFYSWAELGIDPDTAEQYAAGPVPSRILTATWGDTPVIYDLPEQTIRSIAVTEQGVLALAQHDDLRHRTEVLFSADGTEWSPVASPTDGLRRGSDSRLTQVQDGVLLLTAQGIHVGNGDGAKWTRVEIDGLDPGEVLRRFGWPVDYRPPSSGLVHFTDLAGDDGPDVDPLTHVPELAVVATANGTDWYVLETDDEPSEFELATMAMNNDRLLVHPMTVDANLRIYQLD